MELSGIVEVILHIVGIWAQPEVTYYTIYPAGIMMFTVCVTYSVIAPFIMLWGVVYFLSAYWIMKYRLLFVYKPKLKVIHGKVIQQFLKNYI
eukprot:UN24483